MAANDVDAAFAAPHGMWTPVSPRLATARRILLAMALIPLAAVGVVLGALRVTPGLIAAYAVVSLGVLVWGWWLIGRRVRSFGYAERADDLLVVSGILVRRLVIVPYGRMQMVDLTTSSNTLSCFSKSWY